MQYELTDRQLKILQQAFKVVRIPGEIAEEVVELKKTLSSPIKKEE